MLATRKLLRISVITILLILSIAIVLLSIIVFGFFTSADRHLFLNPAKKINFDGSERSYRIYVPKKVGNNPKLVLVFHGFSSDARQMAYISAFHNSTDSQTIVVYPEASKPLNAGQRTGFNAGFCCGSGWVNKIDDVGFVTKLIDELSITYGVDQNKIYAAGFSNGGMFVQRLATDIPDRFAGFASASGSIGTTENYLKPNKPAAMLLLHGEKDSTVPFEGGTGLTDPNFKWKSFQETREVWEKNNGSSKPLKSIADPNNAHRWPDWRLLNFWHKQTSGSEQIIQFFESS